MENSEKPKSNKMDMLHGSLLDKILLFALPLAASSILQQLFNSADIAVVGRFAGSQAQAAVDSNSSGYKPAYQSVRRIVGGRKCRNYKLHRTTAKGKNS